MKKMFALIFTLLLSLSLFSCSKEEDIPTPDNSGEDIGNPIPVPNDLGLDITKESDEYILNGIGSCLEKQIVIPDYVTRIKDNAFPNVIFESIIIPRSVKVIEEKSFSTETIFYIFCEAESKPEGWPKNFCFKCPIVWGYNGLVGKTKDGIKWALNKNNKATIYDIDFSIRDINQSIYEAVKDYVVDSFADNMRRHVDSLFISKDITSIGKGAFMPERIQVDSRNKVYNSKGDCDAVIETKTNKLIIGTENTRIPEGVIEIGPYAFNSVKKLIIPEGVKKIDSFAIDFASEIQLPMSLECIEDSAFRYVSYEEININPANSTYVKNDIGIIDVKNKILIKGRLGVPNVVLENIKEISSLAYCTLNQLNSINKLILPTSLESIGEAAFYNNFIDEIIIPNNVKTIGVEAFNMVNKISVDNRNKYYDSRENCNAIIETKTNKIIAAGNNFFIPKTVTVIEKLGLEGGTTRNINLTNIEIYPLSLLNVICDGVIFGDVIPDSVCASFSFSQEYSVKYVEMSDNVKVIGSRAFLQCRRLSTIKLSRNLAIIQKFAFSNSGLESIYIPKTLKRIEENAFENCYKLKTIYYNGTKEEFEKIAIESGNGNLLHAKIIYNYTY